MAVERTLSIIKPDAVAKNVIGEIISRFEKAGLKVVEARMQQLSQAEAEGFYAVHKERPFFNDLVKFMISGPVFIQVLEGDNAIAKTRELMGATDPKKADAGTSAPTSPTASTPMLYTVPMPLIPRPTKLLTSSRSNRLAENVLHFPQKAAMTTTDQRINLLGVESDSLVRQVGAWGNKPFRAKQLLRWVHQRGISDFDQMTDLAKGFRSTLTEHCTLQTPPVITQKVSTDGTRKWLFDVGNNNAVETVFIPEDDRGTLCISSQAGCTVA